MDIDDTVLKVKYDADIQEFGYYTAFFLVSDQDKRLYVKKYLNGILNDALKCKNVKKADVETIIQYCDNSIEHTFAKYGLYMLLMREENQQDAHGDTIDLLNKCISDITYNIDKIV